MYVLLEEYNTYNNFEAFYFANWLENIRGDCAMNHVNRITFNKKNNKIWIMLRIVNHSSDPFWKSMHDNLSKKNLIFFDFIFFVVIEKWQGKDKLGYLQGFLWLLTFSIE